MVMSCPYFLETIKRPVNTPGSKMYELVHIKRHSNRVWAVAVFADGKKVLSGSVDKTVKIWNWKMIKYYVPTKRVSDLLLSALNEDVVGIIMKYAVATQQELEKKQQKTIT